MNHKSSSKILGVVLDLDGVLWIKEHVDASAISLLQTLGQNKIPFCILTNDCTNSAQKRLDQLTHAGLPLTLSHIITPSFVTSKWLLKQKISKIYYLGSHEIINDLKPLEIVSGDSADVVEAVVVGDLFENYKRSEIETAARMILSGVPFIALQKKRSWSDGGNWYIDNGFWIAAMEYVTETPAVLMGKPSAVSYQVALEYLGFSEIHTPLVSMVSDDLQVDLLGAKKSGMNTIYVGPVIESIPDWLDGQVDNLDELIKLIRRSVSFE